MTRILPVATLGLTLAASLIGCGDREQLRATQMDEASAAEDDARCREKGEPGTEFYDECRKALSEARAQRSAIQYQKARDFDRVLGRGTSDYE
jgi:hypothetical protein